MLHLVVLFYQTTTVLAGRQHTNEIIANIIANGGIEATMEMLIVFQNPEFRCHLMQIM